MAVVLILVFSIYGVLRASAAPVARTSHDICNDAHHEGSYEACAPEVAVDINDGLSDVVDDSEENEGGDSEGLEPTSTMLATVFEEGHPSSSVLTEVAQPQSLENDQQRFVDEIGNLVSCDVINEPPNVENDEGGDPPIFQPAGQSPREEVHLNIENLQNVQDEHTNQRRPSIYDYPMPAILSDEVIQSGINLAVAEPSAESEISELVRSNGVFSTPYSPRRDDEAQRTRPLTPAPLFSDAPRYSWYRTHNG